MTLKRRTKEELKTYQVEIMGGKDKDRMAGLLLGANAQLEADQEDFKREQEQVEYLEKVIESYAQHEKAHNAVIKSLFEAIERHRWQGHAVSTGFPPPTGYLMSDVALQSLKQKYGDE